MADTFGLEIYASNKLAFAGRAKTGLSGTA